MTKLERNLHVVNPPAEAGRARMRKNRREHGVLGVNRTDSDSSMNRSVRQRASRRAGPSIREKLAETQINIPAPSISSVRKKISSAIEYGVSQSESVKQSMKTSSLSKLFTQQSPHRRSEKRSSSIYESTPRAETQRRMKTDHFTQPMKPRRSFEARSEVAPPVMVRGGMSGMAFGRTATSRLQKKKSPRRRFDVPLSVPGAELRLPSVPMFHLGWRAISLVMVVMMAACLFLIWKAPVFQVNTVEAFGLQRLTVSDLNAVMGTFGKSVFTIDPNGLEEALLKAFPELSSASVKINLPAHVKVIVKEREPVISWNQDGTELWMDAEGVSFPPRGTPANPLTRVEGHGDIPNINPTESSASQLVSTPGMPASAPGVYPSIKLPSRLVSAIQVLGAKMPADTLLVYDSEHGLGWNDPNGWEVFFGDEEQDMEMKYSVYQALVERLQSEGIQPALISVEYVHAPYYRMER